MARPDCAKPSKKKAATSSKLTASRDAPAEWISDFSATAKIVLRTHPQLAEELDILDRSE